MRTTISEAPLEEESEYTYEYADGEAEAAHTEQNRMLASRRAPSRSASRERSRDRTQQVDQEERGTAAERKAPRETKLAGRAASSSREGKAKPAAH